MNEDQVVNARHLPRYRRDSDALRDELTYLHADLALLSHLWSFPAELFEAPPALIPFMAHNLTTECVHICFRVWLDNRKGVLTLRKLGNWLVDPGIRPEYRQELLDRLTAAEPTREAQDALEALRPIRHAALAHLELVPAQGLRTPPAPVPLGDLKIAAAALGKYFNAMVFGAEQFFVPMQFYSQDGSWHDGDLGYVLDCIALQSKWFTAPVEHPGFFRRVLRPQLGPDELAEVNRVRHRHRMKPLD